MNGVGAKTPVQSLKGQATWGWEIAVYLFLAGTGAGSYVASTASGFLGSPPAAISIAGVVLGAPLVFLGMLFLIIDLGVRRNAPRAFVNVRTSWMARGAWVIAAFTLLDAGQIASLIWGFGWPAVLGDVAVALALATMFYTGFLLKACRSIPFWSTAILPLLFFFSASSTGVMAVVLTGALGGSGAGSFVPLSQADEVLVFAEGAILAIFLLRGSRARAGESVRMWLTGQMAAGFWGGVVVCGLVVPLLSDAYPAGIIAVGASMSLGLAGGLVLRKIVLAAGTKSPIELSPLGFGGS